MELARWLVVSHVVAVVMASFSLLVLIPYPELWAGLPGSTWAYGVAMEHGGPLHIVLGGAAMLALTMASLGRRAALTLAGLSVGLSLCMELLGTGTGWPFGNYAYTFGLGPKALGRVPYAIPVSWYYVIAASWVLARQILDRFWPAAPRLVEIGLSTWLLTAWDLVLDPAMAHPDQKLSFWIWHTRGAYLGMPLANLAGWLFTGAVIVGLFRWLHPHVRAADVPTGPTLVVYLVNLAFGAVLCVAVGLYLPVLLALAAGVLPALLARRPS